jgi:hypothetical protein
MHDCREAAADRQTRARDYQILQTVVWAGANHIRPSRAELNDHLRPARTSRRYSSGGKPNASRKSLRAKWRKLGVSEPEVVSHIREVPISQNLKDRGEEKMGPHDQAELVERRIIGSPSEFRETLPNHDKDGKLLPVLHGYAPRFNARSLPFGMLGFREEIDPKAFRRDARERPGLSPSRSITTRTKSTVARKPSRCDLTR